ncbi:nuclear transport factor 2 family protein [Rhodococcus sp. 15-649-1-2]|uniref:nuclear transport factor 2 family protein n=1 Tax=Rhodococcoides fascians TaxID=1828 RepID=UPI000689EE70|nr:MULTISPECIES: nuclear transport factor 2 family protein [Rhodococcus]OZC84526.1 nuclear transport factor 2 family protein [Rhodococcus sp. 06-418-1B]OZE79511.1 nuclear transport factor 2 family protein [Rhodococcus sp. 15-649-1-2]
MIDAETATAIQLLYGRQSHAIDSGRADEWARTFTQDGVFDSPSYPQPAVGTAALTAFAEQFFADATAAQEKRRHVITNLSVDDRQDGSLDVDCYLQIMATPRGGATRLVRFTVVHDRVVHENGSWRVACRTVSRDDI